MTKMRLDFNLALEIVLASITYELVLVQYLCKKIIQHLSSIILEEYHHQLSNQNNVRSY